MSLFITGTDTGVGKTHTLTQLLRLLRGAGVSCAGMKPICCGDRRDAELLLAASSEGLAIDEINPIWLQTAAAPFAATLVEKVEINKEVLLNAFAELKRRVDHVFVEGVGGWLVPIRADYFVRDLAADMKLPVLVGAQNRLGCLNHTLLTIESVRARGLRCVGMVLNDPTGPSDVATKTNREVLQKVIDLPILSGLAENTTNLPPEWSQVLSTV